MCIARSTKRVDLRSIYACEHLLLSDQVVNEVLAKKENGAALGTRDMPTAIEHASLLVYAHYNEAFEEDKVQGQVLLHGVVTLAVAAVKGTSNVVTLDGLHFIDDLLRCVGGRSAECPGSPPLLFSVL